MRDGDRRPLGHLSLCTGLGGLDLGLLAVVRDLIPVAYVEREAFAIAHLVAAMEAGELPPAPIHPDLLRFPWEKYRGLVDLVSGGFPCQPFSTSGSKRGVDDPRHLWPRIRDGLRVVAPVVAFFENVNGIVGAKSPGFHSVLHHVLTDLEGLGYRAAARCATAEEVGAPHIRRRWFILAVADDDREGLGRVGSNHDDDRQLEPGSHSLGCGQYVADAGRLDREVPLERFDAAVEQPRSYGSPWGAWPARPGEEPHEWEPARSIEPLMGGGADGDPPELLRAHQHRIERLRALGNAVVPACASLAFVELWKELVR